MTTITFRSTISTLLRLLVLFDAFRTTIETIPAAFARKLRHVKSNRDFLRLVIDTKETETSGSVISQLRLVNSLLSTEADQRIADFDGCRPRDTPVVLPQDSDPHVFYWPTCVNVSRCAGCCGDAALTCTPTIRRLSDIKVVKMKLDSSGTVPEWTGEVTIQLESHTACDCECRIRASDCNNKTQRYDADSCSCRCINESLSATCRPPKHWSQQQCACVCTTILNCLDDEYFNYSSCTCQKFPVNVGAVSTATRATTPGPPRPRHDDDIV